MEHKKTLCIIKPDVVIQKNVGEVIDELETEFDVKSIKTMTWNRARAEIFYAEHKGRPFFEGLVEFMTSGPLVAVALEGPDAVRRWRGIMGPTDPNVARNKEPFSFRARYGTEVPKNGFHGSDSDESAQRELSMLFPELYA